MFGASLSGRTRPTPRAIVVAAEQPEMRFWELKSEWQQVEPVLARECLLHERTKLVNALYAVLYIPLHHPAGQVISIEAKTKEDRGTWRPKGIWRGGCGRCGNRPDNYACGEGCNEDNLHVVQRFSLRWGSLRAAERNRDCQESSRDDHYGLRIHWHQGQNFSSPTCRPSVPQ